MSDNLLRHIQQAQVEAAENVVVENLRQKGLLPTTTKVGIVIDLIRLRELMADFVLEVSPDDPTAYSVPFETFLRWLQRKKQERER